MLTPGGCDLDVVLVHGFVGGFPVQKSRSISQVQCTQLGGAIGNWQKQGLRGFPATVPSVDSPNFTASPWSLCPLFTLASPRSPLSLSLPVMVPLLPVVRKPVRGSLSSKPRTETTVTS